MASRQRATLVATIPVPSDVARLVPFLILVGDVWKDATWLTAFSDIQPAQQEDKRPNFEISQRVQSQMKNDIPIPNLKIKVFKKNLANRVEGLGFVFSWLCLHCWRMPLHMVLWVDSEPPHLLSNRNHGHWNGQGIIREVTLLSLTLTRFYEMTQDMCFFVWLCVVCLCGVDITAYKNYGVRRHHGQVDSLTGATHALIDNAGV